MSINTTLILKNIKRIRENLENRVDVRNEKQEFYKIIENIKLHEIKSDEILDEICNIRGILVSTWRPKQYAIVTGIIIWSMLIVIGSIFVCFSMILSNSELFFVILDVILVILGWLSINMGIHNLGHFIVGKFVGIHFKSWVIRSLFFQWALIIDYKSYLKATFRKRLILHLSGPFCTLTAPWIIYFITLNPIMIIIGIYMLIASLPTMIKKKLDYGRYFKEKEIFKKFKGIKNTTH